MLFMWATLAMFLSTPFLSRFVFLAPASLLCCQMHALVRDDILDDYILFIDMCMHTHLRAPMHAHTHIIQVLRHMQRKAKPMLMLDTHASRGLFDLTSQEANRSPEHMQGINKLDAWVRNAETVGESVPSTAKYYLDCVRRVNTERVHPGEKGEKGHYNAFKTYPGR
jgi:hypothetical protein